MSIRVHVSTSGDGTVVALTGTGNAAMLVHLAEGVGAVAQASDGRLFVDVGHVQLHGTEPEAHTLSAFVDQLLAVADGRSALVTSPAARHDLPVCTGIAKRFPFHRSAPRGDDPDDRRP